MQFPDGRILVLSKAPVPGAVKTRLIPTLGAEAAADLHARLALRTIEMAVAANVAPVEVWCSPDRSHPFFRALALPLEVQRGKDLGERMADAMASALSRSRFAILIGTDIPAMTGEYLREAATQLAQRRDAVVGPAEDGGYVLVGLRQSDPRIFQDVPWGTAQVLESTRARLEEHGYDWHELPCLWDVDRVEDLQRMPGLLTVPARTAQG